SVRRRIAKSCETVEDRQSCLSLSDRWSKGQARLPVLHREFATLAACRRCIDTALSAPPNPHAPIVSTLGPEPWNAPWWKTARGDRSTFLYLMAIHLLAIAGVIFFPVPGWKIAAGTLALTWLGGIGVTVCYHRSLAHVSLRLHPVIRHALIFFAMFNGSGAPDSWTANHRQHHA